MKKMVIALALTAFFLGTAMTGARSSDAVFYADKAIRALQKFEARLQVGISYRDYAPALGEARFTVNIFLDSAESVNNPQLSKIIINIFKDYDDALSVWKFKLQHFSGESDRPLLRVQRNEKLPEPIENILNSHPNIKYYSNIYEYRPYGTAGKYVNVSKIIDELWKDASKNIEEASKIIMDGNENKPEDYSLARIDSTREIFEAVESGDSSLVTSVLSDNAFLANATNQAGETPLHYAAALGYVRIAKVLVAYGANVNASSELGNTPLHLAAYKNNRELVEVLLRKGANPDNVNNARAYTFGEQGTPIHIAIANGYTTIAKMLIGRSSDLEIKDRSGMTPLVMAAYYGREAIFSQLLSRGADFKAKNLMGESVVEILKNRGHWDEIYEVMLEDDIKLN